MSLPARLPASACKPPKSSSLVGPLLGSLLNTLGADVGSVAALAVGALPSPIAKAASDTVSEMQIECIFGQAPLPGLEQWDAN